MSTARQMVGLEDITGQQFGTVRVERMISRHPVPRWLLRCVKCGSSWGEEHSRARYGVCRNNACAKRQEQEQREDRLGRFVRPEQVHTSDADLHDWHIGPR